MHDLIAELGGFKTELANYERRGDIAKDRVSAVKGEIDRVTKEIKAEVERLMAEMDARAEAGQDVLAAQCLTEAKRLARESGLNEPENAAASTPLETAVPKGKRGGV